MDRLLPAEPQRPALTPWRGDDPQAARSRGFTAIGLGFTDYNPHRLPPIGESLTEARAVAETFRTRPLLDAEATEAAVREAMEHSRAIHIATHGRHNVDAAAFQSLFLAPSDALRDGACTPMSCSTSTCAASTW